MAGRLRKSNRNRMVMGVAGGLADYFRVDPVIIRALFILLAL
ncbi:MAG: PspC domain-containing protein, partial [bacterium]